MDTSVAKRLAMAEKQREDRALDQILRDIAKLDQCPQPEVKTRPRLVLVR
ncbi:MAG: hypothetical protein JSS51_08985 [Planctomycetes bacterium]|nr:hypothetical protein [Planctomycetota bacterium]